ncbi:MAG: hypothetical protein IH794_03340 [Acidobacteria bacterium]|nr:hypothetical protein [Acidobacteriota bacterium]
MTRLVMKRYLAGDEMNRAQDQRGVALLTTVVCSALFMLLGLSLTFSSLTEFKMSTEFAAREQALLIADAGFNLTQGILRGNNLSDLLSTVTQVDQYLNFPVPTERTALEYFDRNPLSPVEAIQIDFANPPTPIGTRMVNGLLTAPEGIPIGTGRYFARLSDNDDGDGDWLSDTDSVVILRVMGVHRASAAEGSVYGTTTQNAIAIIETTLRRDTTFNFEGGFTVYGPNLDVTYNGNTFDLDGRPHDLNGTLMAGTPQPGLTVLNNNPGMADAAFTANSAFSALAGMQYDNIVGETGDFGDEPSIMDKTDDIRTGSDPDAANIFDPNWLMSFVNRLSSIAHNNLPGGTYGGVTWGTPNRPEITFIDGNAILEENGTGAGLLVVNGTLNYNGAFTYTGMVFILGGEFTMSGANKTIIGGTFTANVMDNQDGTFSYGVPKIILNGNSNFLYSPQGIALAYSLLPMKVLNWRETTRELEPY